MEDEDLAELVAKLEHFIKAQRDWWWRPAGRVRIRRWFVGAELRYLTCMQGRAIEDVPLPDVHVPA